MSKYISYDIQETKVGDDSEILDYILSAYYIGEDDGVKRVDFIYASWDKAEVIKIYERITGVPYK